MVYREEKLSREDLEAVKRGLEDVKAGRYVRLRELPREKEAIAIIDDKGRVALPGSIRQALGVKAGDMLLFKYDPKRNRVQIIPALSSFDIPTE